jgi:hypothetical protein
VLTGADRLITRENFHGSQERYTSGMVAQFSAIKPAMDFPASGTSATAHTVAHPWSA